MRSRDSRHMTRRTGRYSTYSHDGEYGWSGMVIREAAHRGGWESDFLGTLDEVITITLLRARALGHGPVAAAAGLARTAARRHAGVAWYAPRARDAARARHAAGPRDAGRTRNATHVRLSARRRAARGRRPAAGYRCGRTPQTCWRRIRGS